jgi:hypothetical protein
MKFALLHKILSSRVVLLVAICLGIMLAFALVFHAGASWGERSAIERMRRGPGGPPPFFGFLPHSFMPEGHGAIGIISSTSLPTFTMRSREDDMVTVVVSSSTVVVGSSAHTSADLAPNQTVVIIGSPNNENMLQARVIRVLPASQQ